MGTEQIICFPSVGGHRKTIPVGTNDFLAVFDSAKNSVLQRFSEIQDQLMSRQQESVIQIDCDEDILTEALGKAGAHTCECLLSLWEPKSTFLTRSDMDTILRELEKILKGDGPFSLERKTVVRKNLAMGLIGREGGKISFLDEDVTMVIPPGALKEAAIIYCFWPITEADSKSYSRVEDDLAFYAPTIDCGPDGTEFMQYITLKFKHCITAEDRNKAKMLNVFTRDGTNPEWRKDSDSSFKIDGEWAVLKTKHFCEFTVAASTAKTRVEGDKSRWAVDIAEAMMLMAVSTSQREPLVTPVMQLISYLTKTSHVMSVQPHDTRQLDFYVCLGVTKRLLLRDGPNELLGKVLKGSNYSVSVIGPKGGRLAFLDGSVIMDIPQGALKEPTVITCYRPRTETGKEQSNEGLVTYAPSITCGPDGTTFDKDVTLRVKHFIPADEPDKTNGLDIFTRNDSQPKWDKDAAGSFQIDGEWATLTTNHFSEFTIGVMGRGEDLPRRDVLVSTAIATHDDDENDLDLHLFFTSSNRNQMHQFIFDRRSSLRLNAVEVCELDTARWQLFPVQDQPLVSMLVGRDYVTPPGGNVQNIPANVLRALPASAHALQFTMQRNNNNYALISDVNITQDQLITTLHVDRAHHQHQQQAQ